MIIVWAIAIYRRASLPRLIAMQRRVLAETMIKAVSTLAFHRQKAKPDPFFASLHLLLLLKHTKS